MLDKRSKALLIYIVSQCYQGAFQVIAVADMIKALAKKFKLDADNISQIIKHLMQQQYIEVKHFDETCYCLAPLPKARSLHEKHIEEKRMNSRNNKLAIIVQG